MTKVRGVLKTYFKWLLNGIKQKNPNVLFPYFWADRVYLDLKILIYEDVQNTLNGCTNAESEKKYAD